MSKNRSVFIVGDVHGCFRELMNLLKKAEYKPENHRLILLGDLINKGPQSLAVLSWVRKLCQHAHQYPVDMVLGNHELKFIKIIETVQNSISKPGSDEFHLMQAVEKSLNFPPVLKGLCQEMGNQLSDWVAWIKTWPAYIEEEDFLAVHGGLIPHEHPRDSLLENLVNIRYWDSRKQGITKDDSYPAWHDLYTDSKLVVYAHWAQQGLNIKKNSVGLDTGCVYGGQLTGIWLPEKTIIQTPALDSYVKV